MSKITLKDLAKEMGCDISTVSRALSGDVRVKKETAEKIRAFARSVNYAPNPAARALAQGITGSVWVITTSLTHQISREPSMAADVHLAKRGYDCFLIQYNHDRDRFRRLIQKLNAGAADGAIIIPDSLDEEGKEILISSNVPIVLLDRYDTDMNFSAVCTDNFGAGYALAEKVISHNPDICYIYFREVNAVEDTRCEGYIKCLEEKGVPYKVINSVASIHSQGSYGILANSHKQLVPFVRNNPADRVVGGTFDEWYETSDQLEKVYVARQDFEQMGKAAVDTLLSTDSEKKLVKVPVREISEH